MLKYDIYISGQMTGLPNFNRNKFNKIAALLESEGFTVFNPATIKGGPDWTWADYMRQALQGQMQSKTIFMLMGYEASKGAMIEYELAKQLDMNIVYEKQLYKQQAPIYLPKIKQGKGANKINPYVIFGQNS